MSRSVTQRTFLEHVGYWSVVSLVALGVLLAAHTVFPLHGPPPLVCAEAKRTPVAPGTFVVTLVCRVDVTDEVRPLPPKPSTEESLL